MTLEFRALCTTIAKKIPDSRRTSHGNVLHVFSDIVCIALLAILCGCRTYSSFVHFGVSHKGWLSNFLKLPNGIPGADTFRRCLEKIPTDAISDRLYSWLKISKLGLKNISLDGKTLRGSRSQSQSGRHVLTAFNTDTNETLFEITVQEKQNEITASKQLLEMLPLNGATVRADAMMCQTEIAAIIDAKHGYYCFPVKANQPTLLEDLRLFWEAAPPCRTKTIVEKGHGRIETRIYRFTDDIEGLDPEKKWTGLKAVGCITRITEENGEITTETQVFISSNADFQHFIQVTRQHWRIENNLHWNLDVVFAEDKSRVKKENAPSNFNVLRKAGLCLLERAKKAAKDAQKYISKIDIQIKCMANPRNILRIVKGEPLC